MIGGAGAGVLGTDMSMNLGRDSSCLPGSEWAASAATWLSIGPEIHLMDAEAPGACHWTQDFLILNIQVKHLRRCIQCSHDLVEARAHTRVMAPAYLNEICDGIGHADHGICVR